MNELGVFNKMIVGGKYLICPDCGRIYPFNESWNWCPQCLGGQKLRTINITVE